MKNMSPMLSWTLINNSSWRTYCLCVKPLCQIFHIMEIYLNKSRSCSVPEDGGGGGFVHPPSLENYKAIMFLSHIGLDTLKNHKATKSVFNVRPSLTRQRNAIQWRFAGGPLMSRFLLYLDPSPFHQLKKNEKMLSKLRWTPWDPCMTLTLQVLNPCRWSFHGPPKNEAIFFFNFINT